MVNLRRRSLAALPAVLLAMAACSNETPPAGPGNNPATGGRAAATGGSPATGMGGDPGQGGTQAGGSPGTGGSLPGAGGTASDGPSAGDVPNGTGGSLGGTGGAGGPPPDGGPPSSGVCNYNPNPAALSKNLKFERVVLNDWPAGATERPYNGGITELKFLPGTTDEIFISRKSGQVYHYKIAGTSATLISSLMVTSGVATKEDCGLIGMAFDPDFATNKFVYFGHCTGAASRASKYVRFTYEAGKLTDGVDIFNLDGGNGSNSSWHSVGSMGFDNDKNMWMAHGEFVLGAPAQDLNTNLGKLLRIVPSRMAGMGGSKPAPGNPAATPVYARGLRSPWRGAYHPGKNWYIIADVGPNQADYEEVNLVTQPSVNLGWPNGTCNGGSIACWSRNNTMKLGDADNLSDMYATRAGRAAWAGPPYGDCGSDRYGGAMTGVVLAGDFFKGWVIGMTFDDAGAKAKDKGLATFTMISSVTQGPDGYLYVTKFGKYHQGAEGENVANQGVYRVLPE